MITPGIYKIFYLGGWASQELAAKAYDIGKEICFFANMSHDREIFSKSCAFSKIITPPISAFLSFCSARSVGLEASVSLSGGLGSSSHTQTQIGARSRL